jgi:hypothetical protein
VVTSPVQNVPLMIVITARGNQQIENGINNIVNRPLIPLSEIPALFNNLLYE